MSYRIFRSASAGKFGVFWGSTKVEAWFVRREDAMYAMAWWKEHHPQGPVWAEIVAHVRPAPRR